MYLNSISSNLLLIGFALVSICCLYLLYSNFTKVREIEELKRKVEDLKKIFFNTQQHNDETYSRILSMMQQQTILEHPAFPTSHINPIEQVINNNSVNNCDNDNANQNTVLTNEKVVNIDTSINDNNNQPATIIINKEGSVKDDNYKPLDNTPSIKNDTKEITLDLEELDNFEPAEEEDNTLDDLENENLDNLLNEEQNDNLDNNLDNDEADNTNNNTTNLNIFEINNIDDTISITTDPINEDIDAIIGTIDMDEINTNVNTENDDFTIKNLDETNTIVNDENIKKIDIKNIDINLDEMDLNDILNGNNNQDITDTTQDTTNTTEDTTSTNEIKNNLQNMSIKQLKDLAKIHKVKSTGTKTELITSLSKIL